MTSLSTDQALVDIALAAMFSGIQVDVEGTPTAVRVFIEDPDTEETPERVFPSVSISFAAITPSMPHYESEDFEDEEVGYLDAPPYDTVNERVMRERALPYNLTYMIHTWYQDRAKGDRDLVKAALLGKTKPRWYMPVNNIDGEEINLDLSWVGGVLNRDEELVDRKNYHKVLTIQTLAHLSGVSPSDVHNEKVAMELVTSFRGYSLVNGEVVPEGGYPDVTLKYDENSVEPI